MTTAHAPPPLPAATRARLRARVVVAGGVAMAAVGAVLLVTAPGTSVYAQGSALHVGATTLHLASQSGTGAIYTGDATYTLEVGAGGRVVVHATWPIAAGTASSSCVESTTTVTCTSGSLAWIDTFDAARGLWHRRYGDGRGIDIRVPAGTTALPVAFPVDS